MIRLRDELDHVRNYLTIQKMRYEEKFQYEISVDETLLDHTVLKIILQPLVENSIYHGVRDVSHPGKIRITGVRSGNIMVLTVSDNGLGMEPDDLDRLRSQLTQPPENHDEESGGTGFGVRNVHERIRLYFGDEYGLSIESESEVGTTIECRLPVEPWME
jgi:two-component system sensor histidine kinase YesM